MDLSRFSKVPLCHVPTPLELMENLSSALGGPTIYIKRDDCTGLATGGNKTRKLDFLIGDAIEQGADLVITQGAVQSNHARQTAAAAAKYGLKCKILLERRVPGVEDNYERTGNVLLDRIFDADIEFRPGGTDMNRAAQDLTDQLREAGGKPYFIPGGGSNPVGALGYVSCALELLRQVDEQDLKIDRLIHATGSTGTQAGLVVGMEGSEGGIPVYGISVRNPREKQESEVYKLVVDTAEYVGIEAISPDKVVANDNYVGPGYGQPTPEMVEAVRLLARTEGILLDPVYSGKGMAGLIGEIRQGTFSKEENIIFLHTGGTSALFAYEDLFTNEAA